jgi:hypothetical protein
MYFGETPTLTISHVIFVSFHWPGTGAPGFETSGKYRRCMLMQQQFFYETASLDTARGLATVAVHP